MRKNVTTVVASMVVLTALAGSVQARRFHRLGNHLVQAAHGPHFVRDGFSGRCIARRRYSSQEVLGSGQYNPYADYDGPGSIVLNETEKARREPGVTVEIAPDAKETATGGPVGGVPGFDGT